MFLHRVQLSSGKILQASPSYTPISFFLTFLMQMSSIGFYKLWTLFQVPTQRYHLPASK